MRPQAVLILLPPACHHGGRIPLGFPMFQPIIIQGGMGVATSGWRLARAVSQLGQLGVVSGTLLAVVLARRLQEGDPNGLMRHALAHLPFPQVAERVIDTYYVEGGKPVDAPYRPVSMPGQFPSQALTELTVAANFTEVFLAKEGHQGRVGINLLEKIQAASLASIYGAMLAGVDYVLMGAGIPRSIPGVLDRFAEGKAAELKLDVEDNAAGPEAPMSFDPSTLQAGPLPTLTRPQFLAIVSSAALATTLAKKSNGRVDGFIIEGDIAGGHNAPPRGPMPLTPAGEPIYGPRDVPELAKFRDLGLPFWLAGGYATPEKLAEARQLGAAGVQVGTPFAFCEESGITDDLKRQACQMSLDGTAHVFTDPCASPTGFPFKVMRMPGSLSEPGIYTQRQRVCDLGYLRQSYRRPDGTLGYRCAAEPVDEFVRKGGTADGTDKRQCLCNGLLATVGLGQARPTGEFPIVTAGNDVANISRYIAPGATSYTAADVIRYILSPVAQA